MISRWRMGSKVERAVNKRMGGGGGVGLSGPAVK